MRNGVGEKPGFERAKRVSIIPPEAPARTENGRNKTKITQMKNRARTEVDELLQPAQ